MLQAFNNDKEFKDQMIAAAISHREKDEYIAGCYAKMNGSFKGCSVGCSLFDVKGIKGIDVGEDYADHALLAKELGIPEFICRLQDSIFEGLPESERLRWTERLFNSIPLGADLTPVLPKFLLKTLDRLPETDIADVVDAVRGVKDVLINWAETGEADIEAAWSAQSAAETAESAARSARSAAESAAESVAESVAWSVAWSAAESAARSARSAARSARSAAESAAESVAESVAWSAQSAAESAAESVAWSVAWSAAESAAWEQIANDLVECIEAAK